ncbi:MAG: zinc-binding dehydrogenase [Pseudomonadota bacterium]|nr:zinc-binding dehydrogenase [Pseudomonadota bacterium]
MRAATFKGVGIPLAVEDRPDPTPDDGELVLRIAYCGICGSDLHATQPGAFRIPEGTVLGHEFSGEIVHSKAADWHPGDRIAVVPIWECDECAHRGRCKDGLGVLCPKSRFIGLALDVPGAYAQRTKIRAAHALRLPDGVSLRDGALLEPLAVGAHAVERAGSLEGARVLVIGAGPIGLAVMISAKLAGAAAVVVTELNEGRRERARRLGATAVIDPSAGPVGEAFAAIADNGPDVIFECVGVPGVLQQAIDLSGPRGRLVVVGVCMVNDTILPLACILKELQVGFVLGYTPADFERVLRAIEAGRISADALISAEIGLDELPDAFEALRTPTTQCKVLVRPNPD